MRTIVTYSIAVIAVGAAAELMRLPAQEKSPDRQPETEKARPEDQRSRLSDKGPRREGEPPLEGPRGKGPPDGQRPMPRGGPGGFRDGLPGEGFGGMPGMKGGFGGMRGGEFGGGGGMGGMAGGMFGGGPPDDPEMREMIRKDAEMERETLDLAAQFRRGSGSEREKLKAQVAELVAKHFTIRQERRKLQLKRMEEELKRLREAITKRDDATDSLVRTRIAELLGEPRELDF